MEDATRFNIIDDQDRLLCPVCGFAGYSPVAAYDKHRGLIGISICPCCLWEPGFDDEPSASANAKSNIGDSIKWYRERWMSAAQWQGKRELMPVDWDAERQMAKLLEVAPQVRF